MKQQKILFESWQDQWAKFSHQLSHFEDWVGQTEELMTKGMYDDSPAEMEGYIGTVEVCAVMTLYWLASLAPALLHRINYIHTVMVQLYASEKIMQICDNNNSNNNNNNNNNNKKKKNRPYNYFYSCGICS